MTLSTHPGAAAGHQESPGALSARENVYSGGADELPLASHRSRCDSALLELPTYGRANFCHGPWGQQLLCVRVCYVQTAGSGGVAELPCAAVQEPG